MKGEKDLNIFLVLVFVFGIGLSCIGAKYPYQEICKCENGNCEVIHDHTTKLRKFSHFSQKDNIYVRVVHGSRANNTYYLTPVFDSGYNNPLFANRDLEKIKENKDIKIVKYNVDMLISILLFLIAIFLCIKSESVFINKKFDKINKLNKKINEKVNKKEI